MGKIVIQNKIKELIRIFIIILLFPFILLSIFYTNKSENRIKRMFKPLWDNIDINTEEGEEQAYDLEKKERGAIHTWQKKHPIITFILATLHKDICD